MSKSKELTPYQAKFLDVLFDEAKGDIKVAIRLAGYSENTRVADVIKSLKDEIVEAAKDVLAFNSVKASFALVEGMIEPNREGTVNKVKAAEAILDRVGITKKSDSNQMSNVPTGGLLILPAKGSKIDISIDTTEVKEEKVIEHEGD